MPDYVYGCDLGHTQEEAHRMTDDPVITCNQCGGRMHRIPQVVAVNWGGLPPHLEHSRPPVLQNMVDTAQSRREKYLETKGNK
jgi:predicted nucleic acid-binding Zn ribbon protein